MYFSLICFVILNVRIIINFYLILYFDSFYIFLIRTIHVIFTLSHPHFLILLIDFCISFNSLSFSLSLCFSCYLFLLLCHLLSSQSVFVSLSLIIVVPFIFSLYLSTFHLSWQKLVWKTEWSSVDSTMIIMMQISHEKYDEANFIKCRDIMAERI